MRNPVFDLLRIILTFLVVNIHIRIIIGQPTSNFLEQYVWFAIPFFVVLSFYFSSNKNLMARIKRLFLPLIFWSAIGFIIHPELINAKNISLQLFTGHVVNTPLYYLILLVWFTIINWLVNKFPEKIKIAIYSLIIFTTFFLEYSRTNFNFFYPMISVVEKSYGRFIELIKFVPVGLAFAYLAKKLKGFHFFLLSVLSFIFYLFSKNIPQPPDFHYSGLKIFFGTIMVFSLVLWSSKIKVTNNINQVISTFGQYSFGVYLSHYPILEFFVKIFPNIKPVISSQRILFLFAYTIFLYAFCLLFDVVSRKRLSLLIK